MKKIKTRLLLYFGSSLLVFSVLIGLIFFVLFSRHSTDVHKDDLGRRAERMAATLGELMVADEPEGRSRMQVPGRGGKVGGQGYRAYLRFLDDIALTDVWVVDENREQIVRNQGKHDLPYKELPASADEVVRAALSGQTTYSEDFGTILGAPSLTVAAPSARPTGASSARSCCMKKSPRFAGQRACGGHFADQHSARHRRFLFRIGGVGQALHLAPCADESGSAAHQQRRLCGQNRVVSG